MKWISTIELENWAKTYGSKGNLPWLVSRLIRAVSTIRSIRMPCDKNVFIGGWDGVVDSVDSIGFVPIGVSLWEFGTTANSIGKAEEDYRKRTDDPLGYDPSTSTFVFVTPRIWEGKDEWRNEKLKEGIWKDIKVYDGQDLEQWIGLAPAVGKWFATMVNVIPSESVIGVKEYWTEWASGGKYEILPSLLIGGNEVGQDIVLKGIDEGGSLVYVASRSRTDATAFIMAVIMGQESSRKEGLLSKGLVIERESDFRKLVDFRSQLILIPLFEPHPGLFKTALNKGHSVLCGMDPEASKELGASYNYSRIDRDKFIASMRDAGMSEREAEQIAMDSGRDIGALRRLLGLDTLKPSWASGDQSNKLLPLLLAGSWDENFEGDRSVLSALAKVEYQSFIERIKPFLQGGTHPLHKVGSIYRLVSTADTWKRCSSFLTDGDLLLFKEELKKVLTYINPRYELPPNERLYASIRDKKSIYSRKLREGICNSLIFLGSEVSDTLPLCQNTSLQQWVDWVVAGLFEKASRELWCSLSDVIPLLAEASPNSFLKAVDGSLSSQEQAVMAMFEEEAGMIGNWSHHSGLLWALESIAWLPEYTGRASLVLSKLAENDPGGALSNRPLNSLKNLFLLEMPQTYASTTERKAAITQLTTKFPRVCKDLIFLILPQSHTVIRSHMMKWRRYSYQECKITYPEFYDMSSWLIMLLLEKWGNDEETVAKIVPFIGSVTPSDRELIMSHLEMGGDELQGTRDLVWHAIRELLSNERSYGIHLPPDELERISAIYMSLEPADIVRRSIWKLERFPSIPEGIDREDITWEKRGEIISDMRLEAVRDLHRSLPFDKFIEILKSSADSHLMGFCASKVIEDWSETVRVAEGINDQKERSLQLAIYFVAIKYYPSSLDWLSKLNDELRGKGLADSVLGRLGSRIQEGKPFWDFVEQQSDEFKIAFWQSLNPYLFNLSLEEKVFAIEQFLDLRRYATALNEAGMFHKELPTALITRILTEVATIESHETLGGYNHNFLVLFKELDGREDVTSSDWLNLEMMYLSMLASYGSQRKPRFVFREVVTNPIAFIEVLVWLTKPESDELAESEMESSGLSKEQLQERAKRGWDILLHLDVVPGQNEDGTVNAETVRNWVSSARHLAREVDRITIADAYIAQILGRCPENCDPWPPEAIASIIDELNSDVINRNFSCQVRNNRGMHSRRPLDGGKQERDLAEKYRGYAQSHRLKFPITASILDSVAAQYDADAVDEDRTAEILDLEY